MNRSTEDLAEMRGFLRFTVSYAVFHRKNQGNEGWTRKSESESQEYSVCVVRPMPVVPGTGWEPVLFFVFEEERGIRYFKLLKSSSDKGLAVYFVIRKKARTVFASATANRGSDDDSHYARGVSQVTLDVSFWNRRVGRLLSLTWFGFNLKSILKVYLPFAAGSVPSGTICLEAYIHRFELCYYSHHKSSSQ